MRIKHSKTLFGVLAKEELEAQAVVVSDEPIVQVEAGADSLEADLIDINDEVGEADDNVEVIDEANTVTDELEVTVEALRVISQNGGLDRNGAVILNLHLESLYNRLDMPTKSNGYAPESFGGTGSRVTVTMEAMEDIKKKGAEIWEKIIKMWETAMEHIAALWNKIFDGATKLKARAESVAKASAVKGEASTQEFENPKLAEAIQLSGAVDPKAAAVAIDHGASGLVEATKAAEERAKKMLDAVKGGDLSALKIDGALGGLNKIDPAKAGMAAPGEGMSVYGGEELPGNKTFVVVAPDGSNAADWAKVKMIIGAYDASKKLGDNVKLKVLAGTDIKVVADQIAAAANKILAYKPVQSEVENLKKQIIAAAKSASASTPAPAAPKEGEEPAAPAAKNDAVDAAKGAMALASSVGPSAMAYLLNAGGSVLQYAEQCLKLYKKADAAEKPAAAAAAAEPAAA